MSSSRAAMTTATRNYRRDRTGIYARSSGRRATTSTSPPSISSRPIRTRTSRISRCSSTTTWWSTAPIASSTRMAGIYCPTLAVPAQQSDLPTDGRRDHRRRRHRRNDLQSSTRDLSLELEWNPGQGPLAVNGSFPARRNRTSDLDRLAVFREVNFPSSFDVRSDRGPAVGDLWPNPGRRHFEPRKVPVGRGDAA